MSEMLKQGYDALERDFRDPSSIEPWEKAWEIVKEKVKNAEMPLEIYEATRRQITSIIWKSGFQK